MRVQISVLFFLVQTYGANFRITSSDGASISHSEGTLLCPTESNTSITQPLLPTGESVDRFGKAQSSAALNGKLQSSMDGRAYASSTFKLCRTGSDLGTPQVNTLAT